MSRLTAVVIVSALAALAAGCGGGSCPPAVSPAAAAPAGPPDLLSIRLRDYEAEVCACKTLSCATTAESELSSWVEDHRDLVERAFGNALREVQIESHMARVDVCKVALEDRASPEEREASWSGRGGGADAAIEQMRRIGDEICACKDQQCLDVAMKKMSSMKEPSGKPSKAQMEKAMKIAERMAECQKAIMIRNMPSPPPPPPPRP